MTSKKKWHTTPYEGVVAAVIATYNEADTIGDILDGLIGYDVFVVDDDSPDGTAGVVSSRKNAQLILRADERGIASAYQAGWRAALAVTPKYDFIIQMDAGGTHTPADANRLLGTAWRQEAGLVIGSRFVRPVRRHGRRTTLSLTAAWLMRRLGINVRDATSGFRCWRRDTLQTVMAMECITARGFAFQLETLWAAHRAGAKIVEVPIDYKFTNSTFNRAMVREAMRVYLRLLKETYL